LALAWKTLILDKGYGSIPFEQKVVAPLRELASTTVDEQSVLGGILLPGSISEKIASAYRVHLFGDATLQDLPDKPRFVFNATNVQSGALWRFEKSYMGDYRVGLVDKPIVPLATAVTASSAFPPVLSPCKLDIPPGQCKAVNGVDLNNAPYTTSVVLSDGGVYDNLGLETAWKRYRTIFVSDAGGKMVPEPDPHEDWLRQSIRILDVIDNQVRSLRKRQLIEAYQLGTREGAYWGIRTDIEDYQLQDVLNCPFPRTMELALIPTRLKAMDGTMQERLINWGYAVCDAALRKHVDGQLPKGTFPYPNVPV
jgi:NTE family protein